MGLIDSALSLFSDLSHRWTEPNSPQAPAPTPPTLSDRLAMLRNHAPDVFHLAGGIGLDGFRTPAFWAAYVQGLPSTSTPPPSLWDRIDGTLTALAEDQADADLYHSLFNNRGLAHFLKDISPTQNPRRLPILAQEAALEHPAAVRNFLAAVRQALTLYPGPLEYAIYQAILRDPSHLTPPPHAEALSDAKKAAARFKALMFGEILLNGAAAVSKVQISQELARLTGAEHTIRTDGDGHTSPEDPNLLRVFVYGDLETQTFLAQIKSGAYDLALKTDPNRTLQAPRTLAKQILVAAVEKRFEAMAEALTPPSNAPQRSALRTNPSFHHPLLIGGSLLIGGLSDPAIARPAAGPFLTAVQTSSSIPGDSRLLNWRDGQETIRFQAALAAGFSATFNIHSESALVAWLDAVGDRDYGPADRMIRDALRKLHDESDADDLRSACLTLSDLLAGPSVTQNSAAASQQPPVYASTGFFPSNALLTRSVSIAAH